MRESYDVGSSIEYLLKEPSNNSPALDFAQSVLTTAIMNLVTRTHDTERRLLANLARVLVQETPIAIAATKDEVPDRDV